MVLLDEVCHRSHDCLRTPGESGL